MRYIVLLLIPVLLLSPSLLHAKSDERLTTKVPCMGTALCITEKVVRIIDGDTIYLKNHNKVRLSLTDTPEAKQKGFKEATSFTKKLCPLGSMVTVDQDDKQPFDKYKRVLAKVTCSGKILNAELLDNGHAKISKYFCSKSEFANEYWAVKYGCKVMESRL